MSNTNSENMKRTVLSLSLIIGLSMTGFAQQEELKSAQANLEKKDYIKALEDLNKAKKAITQQISDNLASVLPAKFGEFEMQKDNSGGMDMGMGGGVSTTKTYRKPAKQESTNNSADPAMMDPKMGMPGMGMMEQEEIYVQITTNMMMASEVMNAHSMSDQGMAPSDGTEAYRVKGYRAVARNTTAKEDGMGMMMQGQDMAQAVVGGAYISVEVRGSKEPGQAKKFLELVDLEKLVGIVGK